MSPLIESKGSEGSGFKGFKGGGAAHFVILSGEKGRVLKNGLSENMRTESKDLSAAKYKNSLPQWGRCPEGADRALAV